LNNGKATSERKTLNRQNVSGSACNDLLCGLYDVIYADPPWRYGTRKWGKDTTFGTIGEDERLVYPTMTQDELKRLHVGRLAADNCALFLWATFPTLRDGIDLIEAWGFEYKTAAFVWVKTTAKHTPEQRALFEMTPRLHWGMGYYTRANAELCLLGIRGDNTALVERHDVHQVVIRPVQDHSRKPDEVRRRIECLTGDRRRVELFAREKSDGWDIWGNELPNDVDLTT